MAQISPASRVSLWPWIYLIALAYFAVHLATSTRYGYFRDALYYLSCLEHLAFGYVDQPPLIALLGWITRHTLGTSLPALIFWPALAGAARVVLTAALARELGAGRFGTLLAAALAITPGVWWVIGSSVRDELFGTSIVGWLVARCDAEPGEFSVLVRRSSVPVLLTRTEELSCAILGIRDRNRVLHDHTRQGLLLRTGIRNVVCSRRGRSRATTKRREILSAAANP